MEGEVMYMEEIIKVDLRSEEDLLERYDDSIVNKELINYIISCADKIDKYKKIRIFVNKNRIKLNIEELIKEGFEREYNNSFINYEKTNLVQCSLLILGIVFLVLSFLIGNDGLWHEILLIIGWVPIWEMVHLELFTDIKERKKRSILKRLMNCEIEVK